MSAFRVPCATRILGHIAKELLTIIIQCFAVFHSLGKFNLILQLQEKPKCSVQFIINTRNRFTLVSSLFWPLPCSVLSFIRISNLWIHIKWASSQCTAKVRTNAIKLIIHLVNYRVLPFALRSRLIVQNN